jgi:hypothetical protein
MIFIPLDRIGAMRRTNLVEAASPGRAILTIQSGRNAKKDGHDAGNA